MVIRAAKENLKIAEFPTTPEVQTLVKKLSTDKVTKEDEWLKEAARVRQPWRVWGDVTPPSPTWASHGHQAVCLGALAAAAGEIGRKARARRA